MKVNFDYLIFCFSEKWEKKNITFHENGTLSFNQEKIYYFDESQSVGSEDDVVVVPNIPMLVSLLIRTLYIETFNWDDLVWWQSKICFFFKVIFL